MKKSDIKIKTKKSVITLSDNNYKAAGGQAAVFIKNDLAYKIYHDPKNMIPVAKIHELSQINHPDVLAPIEPIFDISDKPIGFSMKSINGIEFLCKIFTQGFRKDKGISNQDIIDLVTRMQKTLEYIHSISGMLVVDYNEMNFLLNDQFNIAYHIDVDSYQTKSFPANALMATVKDPLANKFTELSDWFSFAIVTFQMYIGIHPFKGFHPDFKPKEWDKRMKLGVSVFDKKVELPDVCQDFSVIPKRHLDWYKAVFIKNERSIPPYPDAAVVAMIAKKVISSKGDFIIKLLMEYDKPIKRMYFLDGLRYVVTHNEIYKNDKSILKLSKSIDKITFELSEVVNEEPVMAYLSQGKAQFFDLKKNPLSSISAENMMFANGVIYTVNNGQLVENSFERLGKLIHRTKIVSSICPSYKVFQGVVVQDDFMKCHLAIPFEKGKCVNILVPELDKKRIIDAQYEGGICILLVENQGSYFRTTLCFDVMHSSYKILEEPVDSIYPINFITLANGLCISRDDEKVVLFKDLIQRKEVTGAPFTASMKLYKEHTQVLFVHDEKLYSVSMK